MGIQTMGSQSKSQQSGQSPSSSIGTLSNPVAPGRKRGAEPIEKSIERRLKRKIKNRESAAHSRARKQVAFRTYLCF